MSGDPEPWRTMTALAWLVGVVILAAVRVSPAREKRGSAFGRWWAAPLVLTAAAALVGTALLMSGRLGPAFLALTAAVLALRSAVPGGRGGPGMGSARTLSPTPITEVQTRQVRARLDRATGVLTGEVLSGPLAGRALDGLSLFELLDLRDQVQRGDHPAVAIVESCLDRRVPGWRATLASPDPGDTAAAAGGAQTHDIRKEARDGAMDEGTALAVLGLDPGADPSQVKAAHRRLMTHLHPDHGGSTWIAARINEAKDRLLRQKG